MILRVSGLPLSQEQDVSLARQHARRLAALAGLSIFDQTRFATSVAVIARNALQHAGGGTVEFNIDRSSNKQLIQAMVIDQGPGIAALNGVLQVDGVSRSGLGIAGARKLVDQFSIDSSPSTGTVVLLAKNIPESTPAIDIATAQQWADALAAESAPTEVAIGEQQRNDLIEALGELRRKESDLKRQLRKIKQLNQKLDVLSLVASKTDNAVIITDQDGYVEWVNDGFTRMTGYDPFEVFGRKPGHILQGPETDPAVVQRIREKLARNESFTEEILNYRRDRSSYWVSMNIFPIFDESGKASRYIAIQSDVTEHRRTEQKLQSAKEAAETLNRAKSEFLANISHEIRTPMNAIIGMTELCLDTELSPEQRDYLNTVYEASNSLLRLLNDILDFSKMEAGKFTIDAVNMSLRNCLDVTIKTLALRAHEKGIELATDLPDDIPDSLVGDPARLRQIFVNLIGNAIKFTQKGEVLVRGHVKSQADDHVVLHFSVIDTGIGIPLEQQEQIFAAFTQADSSTKRQFGGTGLGLAITSQLIEMMGGTIWVESVLNRGTTFHFTVKLGRQLGSNKPQPFDSASRLDNISVLIVDDNATNRQILKQTLRSWKMRTEAVGSGREALQRIEATAQQDPFQIVLIDAAMPDVNGFELAERIKQNPQLDAATIMMLSTADAARNADRCQSLGLDYYVSKPVATAELHDAIQAVLRSPAPLREKLDQTPEVPTATARRSLNILLAEDTPANQRLAKRILEKRGHRVTVAGDGSQALAIYRSEKPDLILMDVQMPVMDGFETTAAIRDKEQHSGQRTPIVAMTAHAMAGDRQRCLEAGMDEYLPKPLNAQELVVLVEKLCSDKAPSAGPTAASSDRPPSSATEQPMNGFDFRPAMRRLEGDIEIFKELAGFFLRDAPEMLVQIKKAVTTQNADQLTHCAHRLKGLVSNFDAKRAVETAARLEALGRDGELTPAAELCNNLEDELARLTTALQHYCATN